MEGGRRLQGKQDEGGGGEGPGTESPQPGSRKIGPGSGPEKASSVFSVSNAGDKCLHSSTRDHLVTHTLCKRLCLSGRSQGPLQSSLAYTFSCEK